MDQEKELKGAIANLKSANIFAAQKLKEIDEKMAALDLDYAKMLVNDDIGMYRTAMNVSKE